jgi:hypothetical protein
MRPLRKARFGTANSETVNYEIMTQPVVVQNLPRTDPALQPLWFTVLRFIIGADNTVIGITRGNSNL